MNFVTIDFETANNSPMSACALGLVKVENGIIVERKEWLIKPTPFEMGYYQNRVHNIALKELVDKPTFSEIWDELQPILAHQTVVAHSASFDFSVLRSVCTHYQLQMPPLKEVCSIALSRVAWQGERGYGLNTLVSAKLDNYTFEHHNALADAEACAHLVLKILEELSLTSVEEVKLIQSRRQAKKQLYASGRTGKKVFTGTINESESNLFRRKEVVFTGTLDHFVRKESEALIKRLGGYTTNFISQHTDYLIVGQQDSNKGYKSSKVKRAEKLVREGAGIQIINEERFLEILSE